MGEISLLVYDYQVETEKKSKIVFFLNADKENVEHQSCTFKTTIHLLKMKECLIILLTPSTEY